MAGFVGAQGDRMCQLGKQGVFAGGQGLFDKGDALLGQGRG